MNCGGTSQLVPRAPRSLGGATGIFDLVRGETYSTQVNGSNWDSYVITGSDFEPLGPAIVDIVLHAEAVNPSPNFSYRVRLEVRLRDDAAWGPPPGGAAAVLLGPITPPITGYVISAVFNDRSKLGYRSRLVLDIQNSSAATLVAAQMYVSAAVRLYAGC